VTTLFTLSSFYLLSKQRRRLDNHDQPSLIFVWDKNTIKIVKMPQLFKNLFKLYIYINIFKNNSHHLSNRHLFKRKSSIKLLLPNISLPPPPGSQKKRKSSIKLLLPNLSLPLHLRAKKIDEPWKCCEVLIKNFTEIYFIAQ
jgi:hypothetical protein